MVPEPRRADPCPACEGVRYRHLYAVADSAGSPNALVRCLGCGLVVAAREPSQQALLNHYAEYSYTDEKAWAVPSATKASLSRLASRLARFRQTGRLLDVGCGSGVVMRTMTDLGWSAEGTELSGVAVERLRGLGYTVHLGALERLDLTEGAFDVVVLSEIIEHLPRPRGTLEAARRLLRPGGALYLTTPNFDALARRVLKARWRVISVPEHLCYFNRTSLARLLRAVGFLPASVVTEGVNPYEILGPHRGPGHAAAAAEKAEAMRERAVGSGPLARIKSLVNAALRATSLGDTLKAIATRPLEGS